MIASLVDAGDRLLWQSYAYLYDGLLDVFAYQDMIAQVAVLADCAGRSVVDVGAGTGNVTRALVQAGAARVTSLDSSANMLGHARRKLAEEVAGGRVLIIQDDAVSAMAAIPEASVDRITAVNFIYALPTRGEFFRQAARILSPGGFLIAAHTTRPGSGPIVREQVRRGGLRSIARPRLVGIACVDLAIDLLAHGGRYDFAPIRVLSSEASKAGLRTSRSLGRCYGGERDGVNELVKFSH